jgi:hypothetical protein
LRNLGCRPVDANTDRASRLPGGFRLHEKLRQQGRIYSGTTLENTESRKDPVSLLRRMASSNDVAACQAI